jgi:hypothetical protein
MSYLIGPESDPNMELIGIELPVLPIIVTKFCCNLRIAGELFCLQQYHSAAEMLCLWSKISSA